MSLAVVINTACLAPHAGDTLSSGRQPYADRAWLMRNILLPAYTKWFPDLFGEIVVVGEYEEGDGYTYVPCRSVYRNCADALLQRQMGFDAIKGNHSWVLFQHDDHMWDPANVIDPRTNAYVLSLSRWTRALGWPLQLNDGSATVDRQIVVNGTRTVVPTPAREGEPNYGSFYHVNGHSCLMKPHVFRGGFKWTDSPPVFTWDIEITRRLAALGVSMRYAPELVTWDLERGATPWQ